MANSFDELFTSLGGSRTTGIAAGLKGESIDLYNQLQNIAARNQGNPFDSQFKQLANLSQPMEKKSGTEIPVIGGLLRNPIVRTALKPLEILAIPGRVAWSTIDELSDYAANNGDASWSDWYNQIKDPTYGAGRVLPSTGNKWLDRFIGFAGDVALDPLTYATLGAGRWAGQAGRNALAATLSSAGASEQLVAKAGQRGVTAFNTADRAAARAVGVELEEAGLRFMGARISGTTKLAEGLGSGLAATRFKIGSSKAGTAFRRARAPMGYEEVLEKLATGRGPGTVRGAASIISAKGLRDGRNKEYLLQVGKRLDDDVMPDVSAMDGNVLRNDLEGAAPEVTSAGQKVRGWLSTIHDELVAFGVPMPKKRDNYLPHIWTPEGLELLRANDELGTELRKVFNVTVEQVNNPSIVQSRTIKIGKYKIAGRDIEFVTGTIDEINEKIQSLFPELAGTKVLVDDVPTLLKQYALRASKAVGNQTFLNRLKDFGVADDVSSDLANQIDNKATAAANKAVGEKFRADLEPRLKQIEAERKALVKKLKDEVNVAVRAGIKLLSEQDAAIAGRIADLDAEIRALLTDVDRLMSADNISDATRAAINKKFTPKKKGKNAGVAEDAGTEMIPKDLSLVDAYQRLTVLRERVKQELDDAVAQTQFAQGTPRIKTERGALKDAYDRVVYYQNVLEQLDNVDNALAENMGRLQQLDVRANIYKQGDFPGSRAAVYEAMTKSDAVSSLKILDGEQKALEARLSKINQRLDSPESIAGDPARVEIEGLRARDAQLKRIESIEAEIDGLLLDRTQPRINRVGNKTVKEIDARLKTLRGQRASIYDELGLDAEVPGVIGTERARIDRALVDRSKLVKDTNEVAGEVAQLETQRAQILDDLAAVKELREKYLNGSIPELIERDPGDLGRALLSRIESGTGAKFEGTMTSAKGATKVRTALSDAGRVMRGAWSVIESLVPNSAPAWKTYDSAMTALDDAEKAYSLSLLKADKIDEVRVRYDQGVDRFDRIGARLQNGEDISQADFVFYNEFASQVQPQMALIMGGELVADEAATEAALKIARAKARQASQDVRIGSLNEYEKRINSPYLSAAVKQRMANNFELLLNVFEQADEIFAKLRSFKQQGSFNAQAVATEAATVMRHLDELNRWMKFQHDFIYNFDRAMSTATSSGVVIDPVVTGNTIYASLLKQQDNVLKNIEKNLVEEFEQTLSLALADEARFNAVMQASDEVPDFVSTQLKEYFDIVREQNRARDRMRARARRDRKAAAKGATTAEVVTGAEKLTVVERLTEQQQEQLLEGIGLGTRKPTPARPKAVAGEDTTSALREQVLGSEGAVPESRGDIVEYVEATDTIDARSADAVGVGYSAAENQYDELLTSIRQTISSLITGNRNAFDSADAWNNFLKSIKYTKALKGVEAQWSIDGLRQEFLKYRKLSKRAVNYLRVAKAAGASKGAEGVDVLQLITEEIRRVRSIRDEGFDIRQSLGDLSNKNLPPIFSKTYESHRGLALQLAPGAAEAIPYMRFSLKPDKRSVLGVRLVVSKSPGGMSFTDWMNLANEIPVKLREARSKITRERTGLSKLNKQIDELEDLWLLDLRTNEIERGLTVAGSNTDAIVAAREARRQTIRQQIFASRQKALAARAASEASEDATIPKFSMFGVKLPQMSSETVDDIVSSTLRDLRSRALAGEPITSKNYFDRIQFLLKGMRDSGFKFETKAGKSASTAAIIDDLGDQIAKMSNEEFEKFIQKVRSEEVNKFNYADVEPELVIDQGTMNQLERADRNINKQREKLALERAKAHARYADMRKEYKHLEEMSKSIQATMESYLSVGKSGQAIRPKGSWQDFLFGKKTSMDEARLRFYRERVQAIDSQLNTVNDRLFELEVRVRNVGSAATTRESLVTAVQDAITRQNKRLAATKMYGRLSREIEEFEKQIRRLEELAAEANRGVGVVDSAVYDERIARLTGAVNARRAALKQFDEGLAGQSIEDAQKALRNYDAQRNKVPEMRSADIDREMRDLQSQMNSLKDEKFETISLMQEVLIPVSTKANNKYYEKLGKIVADSAQLYEMKRPRTMTGEVDLEAEALGLTRRDQILDQVDAQGNVVSRGEMSVAQENFAAAEANYYNASSSYSTRSNVERMKSVDEALSKVKAEIDQTVPLRMNSAAATQWLIGELTDMRAAISAMVDRFKSFRVARIGEKDFNIEELRVFLADLDAALDGVVAETPFLGREVQSAMMSRRRALAASGKADVTPEANAVKLLIQNALKTEGELLINGEMVREMRALMNEARSPEFGQVVVKQLKDGWEEIAGSGVAVGPEARALLQRVETLNQPQEWSKFVKAWDTYNSVFKAYATMSPRFHVRNAMSATFINWADGVSGENMVEGAKLWAQVARDPENWWKSLPQNVQEQYRTAVLVAYASGAGQFDDIAMGGRAVNWWLPRVSRKVGGQVEGSVRLGMALDSVKKGANFDEALARVVRTHFNYSDVSKLDMFARRTFAPFWIFMSRNIPLQVQQMWTKPKAYAIYGHFVKNMSADGEYTPINIIGTDAFKAPFGGDLYINLDLGFNRLEQDIMTFADPAKLMSGATPIMRYPFEMWASKQFYNDRPISGSKYVPLEGVAAALAPVLESMGLVEINANGQKVINEKTLYSVQNLIPYAGTIDRLTGAGDLASRSGYSQASFLGLPVMKGASPEADLYSRLKAMELLQERQRGLGY
jgi:hypothetical protein